MTSTRSPRRGRARTLTWVVARATLGMVFDGCDPVGYGTPRINLPAES